MIKPKSGERCLHMLKQGLLLSIHSFGGSAKAGVGVMVKASEQGP
jgi:hypothetical protein